LFLFVYIFIGLSIAIAIFQISLALGAPLGEFTMGGKYPGKLPDNMRIAAILQIIVLFVFAVIVVSKSGLAFESLYNIAKIGIWVVFAFFIFGSFLNLFSPSKKEKMVMGPLNIIALICTFMVAIK
jgi:hypothetical membrane protein